MRLADFDFDLPSDRIAQHPVRPRDAARLLHVARDGLADRVVRDLPGLLRAGDVLVANDTRVIPAQLTARRGAAHIGITLDQPRPDGAWHALARNARRLHAGDELISMATRICVPLCWSATMTAESCLHSTSRTRRSPRHCGVRARLRCRPISRGLVDRCRKIARTIRPCLPTRRSGGGADRGAALHAGVACRTGHRASRASQSRCMWAPAHFCRCAPTTIATSHACRTGRRSPRKRRRRSMRRASGRRRCGGNHQSAVAGNRCVGRGCVAPFAGDTGLFIVPGYRFRAVDVLVTNFHLPRSTLFMLVCAFAGTERMRHAYAHAIERRGIGSIRMAMRVCWNVMMAANSLDHTAAAILPFPLREGVGGGGQRRR